jgi:ferritin-like metal-binding protein YciE
MLTVIEDAGEARAIMHTQDELDREVTRLRGWYIGELQRLYGGELEHLNVLPAMAAEAQAPGLKSAFQYHCEKTRAHIERLQRIFAGLGLRPVDLEFQAAAAAQPAAAAPRTPDEAAGREIVLIAAARKLENHEIGGYRLALNCAQALRDYPAAHLLEQTLQEEYEADRILAALGTSGSGSFPDKVKRGDRLNRSPAKVSG